MLRRKQENPDILENLKDYVSKIRENSKPISEIKTIFEEADHATFVKAVCDLLILNKNRKMNVVWIYGQTSTGKTEFLDRMHTIFSCAEFKETRGRFDCKYKVSRMAPDYICIDEGATKTFF